MNIPVTIISIAVAAMTMTACQTKKTVAADDKLLDQDTLSVAYAKIYVKNYAKRAGTLPVRPGSDSAIPDAPAGTDRPPIGVKPNTRAVWFSLAKMKALVAKIESEGGDGIRFYYAAYDSTYSDTCHTHIPQRDYWNHNTLLMVSTVDSGSYHWDYYNNDPRGTIGKGHIILAAPENRGEMCPPPANCNTVGALLITY